MANEFTGIEIALNLSTSVARVSQSLTIPATETGEYSALAIELDIAMACDTAAQDRYLAIYGEPYVAVCTFADRAGVTAATTAKTVK